MVGFCEDGWRSWFVGVRANGFGLGGGGYFRFFCSFSILFYVFGNSCLLWFEEDIYISFGIVFVFWIVSWRVGVCLEMGFFWEGSACGFWVGGRFFRIVFLFRLFLVCVVLLGVFRWIFLE